MYWTNQYGDELYDLDADPHELTNLADDPADQTVVEELNAARNALLVCEGASCGRPHNWTPWLR